MERPLARGPRWLLSLAALPAVLSILVPVCPAAALSVTFVKVADTATPIPDGSGSFISFGRNPSIDGGVVAFRGEGDPPLPFDPQQQGVYSSGGGLHTVADQATAIPGTGAVGNFETFVFKPSADGSSLAWGADGAAGQEGVYRDDGSGAELVANRSTLVPGGATGELFDLFVLPPVMQGGDVVFHAEGDGGVPGTPTEGIYGEFGGVLGAVVDSNTVMPGSAETFAFLSTPDLDAGAVAFRGSGASGFQGVYLVDGGLGTVADTTDTAPGSGATFVSFGGEPVLSEGTILFRATDDAGITGLYRALPGLVLVADENTAIPEAGGSTFNIFGNHAIDGDTVVFEGTGTPGVENGIYIDFGDGVVRKIIDLGDSLDGKTIQQLEISKEAVSGNQVTFWARFTNGSEGVFVANVPEPGAGALLALGLALLGAARGKPWR